MNKNVLILVDRIGPKSKYLANYLKKRLSNDHIFVARFSDFFFEVDGKGLNVSVGGLNKKLADFDFIFFRKITSKFLSIAGNVAICANCLGINYIDTTDKNYSGLGLAGNKFSALLKLSFAGLSVPHSIFCLSGEAKNRSREIITKLGFPIVAKEFNTQHGQGIRVIRSCEDFNKIFESQIGDKENQFLFQKFIDIEKEYRFLVIGGKLRSVQRMYRDTSKFKLKIDWNREEEFFPIDKFPKEMQDFSVNAAKILSIQVAGVDLAIEKKTGKVWIFEVNRGPGFTYDVKVSPEIPALADFFEERINFYQKSTP